MADLVTVVVHKRELSGFGRRRDQFVDRFKRYLTPHLSEILTKEYPMTEGYIVSFFPSNTASEVQV